MLALKIGVCLPSAESVFVSYYPHRNNGRIVSRTASCGNFFGTDSQHGSGREVNVLYNVRMRSNLLPPDHLPQWASWAPTVHQPQRHDVLKSGQDGRQARNLRRWCWVRGRTGSGASRRFATMTTCVVKCSTSSAARPPPLDPPPRQPR